ncbi:hypothetical protein GCM10010307_61670 [Streptomyces vastus]|uniref:Uncharacterized protein n=1 Tax=Streptomyces vastus TaxID=285451 RepID=A0ABP6DSH3_9ACTN
MSEAPLEEAEPALSRRQVTKKPLLMREVDDKVVPPYWRKAVYANKDLPQGAVDRDAYVVCVLEQLYGRWSAKPSSRPPRTASCASCAASAARPTRGGVRPEACDGSRRRGGKGARACHRGTGPRGHPVTGSGETVKPRLGEK